MRPFERFKKFVTEENLWIYILTLGKEITCEDEVRKLIFERFGFLPGNLLVRRVLFRLRTQGYIERKKYRGKNAYKTTKDGLYELEKMKSLFHELMGRLNEEQ